MDDGFNSYEIAHASKREWLVRRGEAPPVNGREDRWLLEGPRDWKDLDTVREGLPGDGERTPPAETLNTKEGSVT